MLIKNVTREDLDKALAEVNKRYDNNVIWNRIDYAGRTRTGSEKWNITLRVVSSKGKGHRLSVPHPWHNAKQRRLIAACWHVHGYFMQALGEDVEIISKIGKTCGGPYTAWEDADVGSQLYPAYLSELCECED